MNYQLTDRMEDAQNHVECNPGKRKPACPVMSAQQKCSANNRKNLRKFGPNSILLPTQQVVKVGSKPEHANRQI